MQTKIDLFAADGGLSLFAVTTTLPAQQLLQRSGLRESAGTRDCWPVYALSRKDFQRSRPINRSDNQPHTGIRPA